MTAGGGSNAGLLIPRQLKIHTSHGQLLHEKALVLSSGWHFYKILEAGSWCFYSGSYQVWFPPPLAKARSGDGLIVMTCVVFFVLFFFFGGGGCYCHLVGGGQGCGWHLTMHRTVLHTQNDQVPNAKSAEIEKPRSSPYRFQNFQPQFHTAACWAYLCSFWPIQYAWIYFL